MTKQKLTPEQEEALKEIIAGKPLPENEDEPQAAGPEVVQEIESDPVPEPSRVPVPARTASRRRKDVAPQDYAGLFLEGNPVGMRVQIYIDRSIYESIQKYLAVISPGLGIPTHINNILTHHLKYYEDTINDMYMSIVAKKPLGNN